jgi:hypothetical protein
VIEFDRFKRERPGVWTCIHATTIGHVTIPSGVRLYAGSPVDGIDVARMLEEAYDKQRRS